MGFLATRVPWFRAMLRRRGVRVCIGVLAALFVTYAVAFAALVIAGLSGRVGVADVAVVPGNKVERTGVPSNRLRARLDRAEEVYRQGMCRAILVSGGFGREGFDEAVVMKDYLVGKGVPADRILVDSAGVDTWSTARNAARIMREKGMKKCIVVTQYFHIPRTRLALRRCGVDAPYSASAQFFEMRDLYSVVREVPGYVKYALRSGGVEE